MDNEFIYQRDNAPLADYSDIYHISRNIWVRKLLFEDGRAEFVISITDKTTSDDWRNAWPIVDQIRASFRREYGTDIRVFTNRFIYNLACLKAMNWSYAEIAREINYDCLVLLCQLADESADKFTRTKGYIELAFTLEAVRIKPVEANKMISEGIRDLRDGYSPWLLDDQPIRRRRVIDTLRQYQTHKKNGELKVLDETVFPEIFAASWWRPERFPEKYRNQAFELLKVTFPTYYEKYQTFHQTRIERINASFGSGVEESG